MLSTPKLKELSINKSAQVEYSDPLYGFFHNLFALSCGSLPGTYNHQSRNHKASQN